MAVVAGIQASVTLQSAGFVQGAAQVQRAANQMIAQNAAAAKSFSAVQNSVLQTERGFNSFALMIRGGILGTMVREVIQTADAMTLLAGRLQVVSKSAAEAANAQRRLVDIAFTTRAPLQEVSDLYVRMALILRDLGASSNQLLAATDLVAKTLVISGGSAQAATAGLVQFTQAMGEGTLRGQELASVMEQNQGLAKAIAEGLGVTTSQLKQMGRQGQLTNEDVLNALLKNADKINEQFAKLPKTVGQSLTQLGTAFSVMVGSTDQAAQGTAELARVIGELAALVKSPEVISGFQEGLLAVIETTRKEIYLLINAFTALQNKVDEMANFAKGRLQDMGLVGRNVAEVESEIARLSREREQLAQRSQEAGVAPESNMAIQSRNSED